MKLDSADVLCDLLEESCSLVAIDERSNIPQTGLPMADTLLKGVIEVQALAHKNTVNRMVDKICLVQEIEDHERGRLIQNASIIKERYAKSEFVIREMDRLLGALLPALAKN